MTLTGTPHRGRHRAYRDTRTSRQTRNLILVGIVIMVALTIAAVMLGGTSQADTTPAAGKTQGTIEKIADVAPYDKAGRWPSDMTGLCIEDHAGRDWPIQAAAAEFDGIIAMTVRTDCSDARYVVEVHLAQMDRSNSAWFDTQRNDDGEIIRARIRLNTSEAYRMDPEDWRMALVHELGHAAGLSHTHEGHSVMDPYLYRTVEGLTEQDRQQLDRIYGGY